jgi:surface carbohydrate biosynthesis protein
MMDRVLIIPSENRNREFDAKLLLGCVAVEAGFRAIVGSRHDIHASIADFPQAIYLAKDLRSSSARMSRILTRLGHEIVAWDEEALVYHTPAQYLAARVDPEVMQATSMLFAWGDDNAEIWRSAPSYHGVPIRVVGNPRLDLLRPELRKLHEQQRRLLKVDFGDYILINSNFGTVNHILPNATETVLERFRDAEAAQRHLDLLAYRREMFGHFLTAASALARAFPATSVVVRPHPSEDPAPWEQVARDRPNLHVRHDGGIVPWLLGAQAVIHNGCTTAIEASLLGKSAIAYQPIRDSRFDIQLPNSVSQTTLNLDDLLGAVAAQSSMAVQPGGLPAQLNRHLAVDASLSCDRIVGDLLAFANRGRQRSLGLRRHLGRVQAFLRQRRKAAFLTTSNHKNSADYNAHRFPPIDVDSVKQSVAALEQCLGRFGRVNVCELRPNVFELRAAR